MRIQMNGARFRNRMLLLAVGLFCGAYSVLFVAVLSVTLVPELQDPIFAVHQTAIIESMDPLREINARTGVRAYAFDEHGNLTFRTDDTTLSADALLHRYQDLAPEVAQLRARKAPSVMLRLDDLPWFRWSAKETALASR